MTKDNVLANCAPRHYAGTLLVYMRLGKASCCAAVELLLYGTECWQLGRPGVREDDIDLPVLSCD